MEGSCSIGPHKSKPIQTIKKTANNKKVHQKNKKCKSVSSHLPKHPRSRNKKSRSDDTQLPEKPRSVRTPKNPMDTKILIIEIEKLRSGKEASTPKRMASVAEHPKNCLFINSSASIHIVINKERLGGLVNLNRPLKIQAGGKLIHLSQTWSQHQALQHLPLPVSTCHYSKNAITNLLAFAKLAGECYIICNTRANDTIYVQSKKRE